MREEKKCCTIYLLRHGESEANVSKTVQGHTDSPLTEKGKRQAKELAEALSDVEFSAIYSSDLKRARDTAEVIKGNRDVKIETSELLREKYFGIFEGKKHSEYIETLKDEFEEFESRLTVEEMWKYKAHSSIESDEELLDRFMKFLKGAVAAHLGKKILIVGHRYLIRMFLVSLGFGAYENLKSGALKPGGYAVLESNGKDFVVKEIVGAEKPDVA